MTSHNYLADNLQFLRIRKRLSQQELAQALGLTRSQIASYENYKAEPSANKLSKIAGYFSVSLNRLLETDLRNEIDRMAVARNGNALEDHTGPKTGYASTIHGFETRSARLHRIADGLLAMHELKRSNQEDLLPEAKALQRDLENLFDFTNNLMLFNAEIINYLKTITEAGNTLPPAVPPELEQ